MLGKIDITYSAEKEAAYDQNSYAGRIMHFLRYTNPLNALCSSATVQKYKKLLEDFEKDGYELNVTDKELWKAKYASMANLHPETGKEIPRLFRMSSFVLVNIPIAVGLALTAPTPFNVGFWQVVNQSYNFGVNIANANATNASASYNQMIKSYGLAVTSAASISLSALYFIKRSRWSNNAMFLRLAPFCGVAVASCLNLFSSRYRDTKEGIHLRDAETGELIEDYKSPTAGKIAFWQCAATRGVFLPFIVTMIPPLVVNALRKRGKMPKSKLGGHIFNIGLVASVIQFALPLGLAMFPQEVIINRKRLESQFQNLRNSRGDVITNFTFNKGL